MAKSDSDFIDRLIERLDRLDPSSVQGYVLKLVREKGLLEKEQIQRALEYQQRSGEKLRLGDILVKFGYVSREDILKCIGEPTGPPEREPARPLDQHELDFGRAA